MGDIGLVAHLTPRSTIDLLRRAGAGTSGRGEGEHGWRGERRQSARHGGRGRSWGAMGEFERFDFTFAPPFGPVWDPA